MPTVAELERLQALTSRLSPLTTVQRGALIRAQDWNTVVGALIEIARAVLGEGSNGVVPPHEHTDQVTTGWLDPRLRTFVERGPLSDPASVARFADLERQVQRLVVQLQGLDEAVKAARDRVADIATRDLTRQADVTSVRRVVESLADGREEVRVLRETLGSIQENVRVAVELGSRLQLNGQPVDMQALDARIRSVEELRTSLTSPSGQLLDARNLEIRLTELTNTLVTQQQLDEALRLRQVEIPQRQLDALQEDVATLVRRDSESFQGRLAEQLRNEVSNRLADVEGLAARAVGDALPGLRESLLSEAQSRLATDIDQSAQELRAFVDEGLARVAANMRSEFDVRLSDVTQSIGAGVRQEFDRQLPSRLESLRAEIADLSQQLVRTDALAADHDEALRQITPQLASIPNEQAIARAALEERLTQSVIQRTDLLQQDMLSRLNELNDKLSDRIRTTIDTARADLMQAASQAAVDAVARALPEVTEKLRGQIVEVARGEVAGLADQLPELVKAQIQNSAGELVSLELRRATERLPELVRAQFDDFQPELKRRIRAAIDERLGPQ